MICKKEVSRNLNEFIFLPQVSSLKDKRSVSLKTRLSKNVCQQGLELNIPIVSAAMDSVTSPDMGVAIALEGGISFISAFQEIEQQVECIKEIKKYKVGLKKIDYYIRPNVLYEEIADTLEKTNKVFAITDNGKKEGEFLGILSKQYKKEPKNDFMYVKDNMVSVKQIASNCIDENMCNVIALRECDADIFVIKNEISNNFYLYDNHIQDTKAMSLDEKGRILVGAAINTRDYKERVDRLVDAGADILCIDTMDGYGYYVVETLKYIREQYGNRVLVGAGNIVEENGFLHLVEAGADFVKIGMSGGVISPDWEMYGVGLGQATAITRVAKAREHYLKKTGIYIPLCADGYIRNNYQIALALAFGADFVMMGRYFAGFDESPGKMIEYEGRLYKEHSGQCSEKVLSENTSNRLVEKGIDSLVRYKGKLADVVEQTKEILYRIFLLCDSCDIATLRKKSIIVPISNASCGEKQLADVIKT